MDDIVVLVAVAGAIVLSGAVWAVFQTIADKRAAQYRRSREMALFAAFAQITEKHADTLWRRVNQLIYQDEYGRWIEDKWRKEARYFYLHFVRAALPFDPTREEEEDLLSVLFDYAAEAQIGGDDSISPEAGDGVAYERYVAEILTRRGCQVTLTPITGDQGVDLLVERDGRRIAIQCKNYISAVGNEAVQQVYAGARFHHAHAACVVAPNGFTVAARQLAASLEVTCLHHDEVPRLFADAPKMTPSASPLQTSAGGLASKQA